MSIDWIAFADSLDDENFEELTEAIKKRLQWEAEVEADSIVLTFEEIALIQENPQQAAINVAKRLKVSPFVAKAAVELAIEYQALENDANAENDANFIEEEQDENGEWHRIFATSDNDI